MDTDSAYMALSGNLEDIIRPELKRDFYVNYNQWFPRQSCTDHQDDFVSRKMSGQKWDMNEHLCCLKAFKFDRRTPGLFKEEFSGKGIIALNSKTYYCWKDDSTSKFSCKGISKNTNQITKELYASVLSSRKTVVGTNTGFIKKNGKILTYKQHKTGLSYFYAKRKVCDDGVSTEPIDI